MTLVRQALALAIGLCTVWLAAPNALAQPIPSRPGPADIALAEQYSARAFEAYERKSYTEAVALYERARASAPSADMLYNLARIHDLGLRQPALAIDYYRRYSADPEAVPDRVEIAKERMAALEAAALDSTERTATERAATQRRDASVNDSPRAALAPPSRAPASPSSLAPAASSWTALRVTALAVGGVGIVGIGIGAGFGLSARAETDTWERYCAGNDCTSQRGVDAADSAARQADVATLGFAAGGVLVAVGAVLWWMGGPAENPSHVTALRLSPVAPGSELGWSVSGSFW